MKGIDISSHNGSINFNAVKNDGVEVVIIKSSEGIDFRDDYLDTHYWGAKNAGISHIGFYHFMSERTDPRQQARDFFDAIRDKSYDVKPCLDIETNNQGRSASQITDRCLDFIDEFKNISGQDVMVYTGGYFGRDELDDRIKCYGGWIAHYGVDSPMNTGFPLVGHQYTESGSIAGVDTNCDVNNFNEGILLGSSYLGGQVVNCAGGGSQDPVSRAREFVGDRCGELQSLLISKGYDCGGYGVDNQFGQGTYNSLIQFQNDNGLNPDGLAGDLTFAKLNENVQQSQSAPQPVSQPKPQVEAKYWVGRIQMLCNEYGANIAVDNLWGSQTENAVNNLPLCGIPYTAPNATRFVQERVGAGVDGIFLDESAEKVGEWQRNHGLNDDQIVGGQTYRSLALD